MGAGVSADTGARERLTDKEIVQVAFALAHTGHPGIPGAPLGVKCPRCESERALERLALAAGVGEARPAEPEDDIVSLGRSAGDSPSNPARKGNSHPGRPASSSLTGGGVNG
jgi:hypothetical protein